MNDLASRNHLRKRQAGPRAVLRGESPLLPELTRYAYRLGVRVDIIGNDPSGANG
jgi:hypothetical protein